MFEPVPDDGPEDVKARSTAVRDLRSARRRNRLGNLEWFELLYRVYLAAIMGGGGVLFLSGLVPDDALDAAGVQDVIDRGPSIIGLVVVLAFGLGLRSGAGGGPLALEHADVHHLILAPVPRRRVLVRPAISRLSSLTFAGAATGAVLGQLGGRRLPGSLIDWAAWGAVFGVGAAAIYLGTAFIAHAVRLSPFVASAIGLVLLTWQAVAVAEPGRVMGPGDAPGRQALAPIEGVGLDVAWLVVPALLVAIGFLVVGRASPEAMVRRSGLVAQLRFAVTMQDLRTVMLLRRQLSQEQTRARPWWPRSPRSIRSADRPAQLAANQTARRPVPLDRRRRRAIWARSWHGFARFPARRLARMVLLVALASTFAVMVQRGVTPAVLGVGLALFVLGLEALEPLAQALDQSDLAGSLPMDSGKMNLAHLAAPAVMLVPFALIGVGVALLWEPHAVTFAIAMVVAGPLVFAGSAAAAINVVHGAPDPIARSDTALFMPPEVSGLTTVARNALPPAIAVVAALPLLFVRIAARDGAHVVGAAVRASLAMLVVVGAVGMWLLRRDDVRRRWREAMQRADLPTRHTPRTEEQPS